MVRALAEEGSVKRALHVYQKMRKSLNIGVKPDSQTYTLLMQTAIKKHQPGVAYILLTNAQEEGGKRRYHNPSRFPSSRHEYVFFVDVDL